jgi:dolichol kinase
MAGDLPRRRTLGAVAGVLIRRHVPADAPATGERAAFDHRGTVLLALSLAAYTLAMTAGRGRFGALNVALLAGAIVAVGLFVLAQTRSRSPLIRPAMLRSRRLSTGLATSGLVSTVMMTTLVVGPFYLTDALDLNAALVGVVMTIGPAVAALTGVPAGRVADRFGARRTTLGGLAGIAAGSLALAVGPATVAGYIAPIVLITAGYAVFQTANNTSVMTGVTTGQRGVTSGMLNLSRNLGLITGASVMGAVFSLAAGDLAQASPGDIAGAMHVTFVVALALIGGAILIARRGPIVSPA